MQTYTYTDADEYLYIYIHMFICIYLQSVPKNAQNIFACHSCGLLRF